MPTIKAVIRKNKINQQGQCVVYLRYGHRQKTIDISLGLKVEPLYWNDKKEIINTAVGINKNKNNEELILQAKRNDLLTNTKINQEKATIMSIVRNLDIKNEEPDIDVIKHYYLNKEEKFDKKLSEELLVELWEEFISIANRSESTKEKYTNAVYHIVAFENHKNIKLRIKDINLKFYDNLIAFLCKDIKKNDTTNGLSDNTIGTTIKNLKVFLAHLIKRGYPIPNILSEMKRPGSNVPIIFLTESELEVLRTHQFDSPRLTKVRDVFVFNCYTGLRFSDLERLSKAHIIEDSIQLRAFKNQRDVYVPLTKHSKDIIEKYDYELPIISEQKFNEYIKEACKEAEIKSLVEIIKTSSGNKTYTLVPKHSVITSHIAIKTFISLCGKKGISPKIVSEITGKSVQVILKHYYGIDKETIQNQMVHAFAV